MKIGSIGTTFRKTGLVILSTLALTHADSQAGKSVQKFTNEVVSTVVDSSEIRDNFIKEVCATSSRIAKNWEKESEKLFGETYKCDSSKNKKITIGNIDNISPRDFVSDVFDKYARGSQIPVLTQVKGDTLKIIYQESIKQPFSWIGKRIREKKTKELIYTLKTNEPIIRNN